MPRRACKKDANQDEIVDEFTARGWDVMDTHEHAQYTPGFPDLLAIRWGRAYPIEVKNGRGKLTEDERAFAALHPDWAPLIVRTVDDVVELDAMVREEAKRD